MSLRINNNIPAVNALRNLDETNKKLAESLARLSSGFRINKGADSPAGLVISEQMRAQLAGLNQAIANSELDNAMIQTTEGALTEVNNLLIRMRQLALQAANEGANDARMLAADQAEVDNSLDTIDRIALTSQFGTRTLFDGSNGPSGVAVGNGVGNTTAVGVGGKTMLAAAGWGVAVGTGVPPTTGAAVGSSAAVGTGAPVTIASAVGSSAVALGVRTGIT